MLILTRRVGETIILGPIYDADGQLQQFIVTVTAIKGNQIKLGFSIQRLKFAA